MSIRALIKMVWARRLSEPRIVSSNLRKWEIPGSFKGNGTRDYGAALESRLRGV